MEIIFPVSTCETRQFLEFPLNGLQAQSRVKSSGMYFLSMNVKSSGMIATFSFWTGMIWDGLSSIPDQTVILLWVIISSSLETVYHKEVLDDCWVGEAIVLCITTRYDEIYKKQHNTLGQFIKQTHRLQKN